jgi:transposase
MVKKHSNSYLLKSQRRKFTSEFKSKVVLEAIAEKQSLSELAEKFDLDSNQISDWKKKFLAKAHLVFDLEEPSEDVQTKDIPLSDNENVRFT